MYRERRQLKSREHLGILEKKRDYKRRAKDFHSKENVISKVWGYNFIYDREAE
jgi:U3 small nucleolar RNA-associated protein 11